MKLGEAVSFVVGENTLIIGWVTAVDEGKVDVIEAHAFHRMWGGSNNSRGEKHTLDHDEVKSCPTDYRHIVKEVREKAAMKQGIET
jgi:hypothetical protein